MKKVGKKEESVKGGETELDFKKNYFSKLKNKKEEKTRGECEK